MTLGATAPGGLCLAIPSYGQLPVATAFALAASMRALAAQGIAHDLIMLSGNCHVDDARNSIIREFLAGPCEHLMFIDADLSWAPEDLVRMASSQRDVIAGIYPHKQDVKTFPVRHLKGLDTLCAEVDGALEVDGVPAGFLRISRKALTALAERAEKYFEQDGDAQLTPKIFERLTEGSTRFSGDYVFCRKWREIGGQVFIDAEIHFAHVGEKEWRGCYGAHLRAVNGLPLRGLLLTQFGLETAHTLRQLHEEWGNGVWAAPVEMLQACVALARGLAPGAVVMEVGSGLSTLCMAAANPLIEIHSIEHDASWLSKITDARSRHGLRNIRIHYAPIVDGWHDPLMLPREIAAPAAVVVDGPPRDLADRLKVFEYLPTEGTLIIDDMSDRWRAALRDRHRKFSEVGRFAVVAPVQAQQAAA